MNMERAQSYIREMDIAFIFHRISVQDFRDIRKNRLKSLFSDDVDDQLPGDVLWAPPQHVCIRPAHKLITQIAATPCQQERRTLNDVLKIFECSIGSMFVGGNSELDGQIAFSEWLENVPASTRSLHLLDRVRVRMRGDEYDGRVI